MIPQRIKIVKSTRVCLLNVLTTPRVGQTKIPLQRKKETMPSAGLERRNRSSTNRISYKNDKGQKYIKNISNENLTDAQITLISRVLKFIPTNAPNKNKIRRQLLRDFEDFARRMRLKYMFHGQNREIHPFYVKSDWNPPVQPSVALESYLEEVKLQLAEIHVTQWTESTKWTKTKPSHQP